MATTRNGYFRDLIYKAMEKLNAWDNNLKVLYHIDDSKIPSIWVFVADEQINQRTDLDGMDLYLDMQSTVDFSVLIHFTVKDSKDMANQLNEAGDEWIERIEYELKNIDLDGHYTHEYNGSDYYRVDVNSINIQKNERGFSLNNKDVEVLSVSGKINYSITYL